MSRSSLEHAAPTTRPSPPLGLGELGLLDEELYRLARSAGRLRLRMGQALHRLGDGYHELGFSTLGAYALERCCRGGRWAAESRALARRLESLPQLSAALESGSIGWSMAELLARHATPAIEAALLQVAGGKTVQAMRIALSPDEPPDDDELARTLSLAVPVEEAWALEATRMMVEHMDGHSGEHWLESLLAEGYISLLERIDPHDDEVTAKLEAEDTAWRTQMKRLQLLHAEATIPRTISRRRVRSATSRASTAGGSKFCHRDPIQPGFSVAGPSCASTAASERSSLRPYKHHASDTPLSSAWSRSLVAVRPVPRGLPSCTVGEWVDA